MSTAAATTFDIAVIGGGINGAGIAADAAGRGLSVVLIEKGDLGGATSSASSKLIHGGLRYLEQHQFRLVREALSEREVLLSVAPHIVRPLRFILPVVPGMRSRLLLRLGLLLYDHLGTRRTLPSSGSLRLRADPAGKPLRPGLDHAFAYWDCAVDDARLVALNARAAADRGTVVATRTRVEAIADAPEGFRLSVASAAERRTVHARAIVNAAGPWAGHVLSTAATGGGVSGPFPALRLVRGSHVVVPRYAGADDAYLMQRPDGRVVFALPIAGRFTMIGTTDVPQQGSPDDARPTPEEESYLIDAANEFFARRLSRRDVVWAFAGVRPLRDDGAESASAVSRDWSLDVRSSAAGHPFLTVLGGKITTYRRLAEAALEALSPAFPRMTGPWTATAPLPGGDLAALGYSSFDAFTADLVQHRPLLEAVIRTLVLRYGTVAQDILGDARTPADLGPVVAGLSRREVDYLAHREWATTADDVLWRRTKAGLDVAPAERAQVRETLDSWLSAARYATA